MADGDRDGTSRSARQSYFWTSASQSWSGVGVLQALRANAKNQKVRVVILSNYSKRELGDRVAKLGVLDT